MDQLWSPWRMEYILHNKDNEDCIFCHAYQDTHDEENLVLYRGKYAYVILNKYPYNTGHSLIIPYTHTSTYEKLTPDERSEMMELLNMITQVLRKTYNPEAFNVGANIGAAAGAGIAPHVHFHILPRWSGDTNFLTTVIQTRVIPEELHDTYAKLKAVWQQEFSEK